MPNIKKVGEYDESTSCNQELDKQQMFSHISGFRASMIKWIVNTPFRGFFQRQMVKMSGIDVLRNFEYEDIPTKYPIVESNIVTSDTKIDLQTLLVEKSDWPYRSIYDYNLAYKSKNTTPSKIIETILSFIESEPVKSLKAFSEIKKEDLIKSAQESTDRYNAGSPLSVIDGIPFVVKDHISIKNMSLILGSEHSKIVSNSTATVVTKLTQKGCLMVGTVTMSGFGCNPFGYNTSITYPTSHNPWNTNKYPGGTSSGSAVTVACGLIPFSLGSDSLGSIRIPASFTGIVGLKPTLSRVSNYEVNCSQELQYSCVIGSITNCVADAALVYSVISGPDKEYPVSLNQPTPIPPVLKGFDIKSVKFGICQAFINFADRYQIEYIKELCKKLEENECKPIPIDIPELKETSVAATMSMIKSSESLSVLLNQPDILAKSNDISAIAMSILSERISQEDMKKIDQQRTRSLDIWKKIFDQVDIILLPTTCSTAPDIASNDHIHGFIDNNILQSTMFFVTLASFTGCPAISINIGYEPKTNMPIGVQLISKWWSEDILLSAAYWVEQMFPLTQKPPVFVDPLK